MDDPFSTAIRKFIPWPEYQSLEHEVSRETLIGQENAPVGDRNRVKEMIVRANQAKLWRMDLITEYGSVGEVTFQNREIIP